MKTMKRSGQGFENVRTIGMLEGTGYDVSFVCEGGDQRSILLVAGDDAKQPDPGIMVRAARLRFFQPYQVALVCGGRRIVVKTQTHYTLEALVILAISILKTRCARLAVKS